MDHKWYVLRAAQPLKAVLRMRELKTKENGWPSAFKELRAPIRYVKPSDRAKMKREHPMVFNYIFALARLDDISTFLAENPDLKTWVLNRKWEPDENKSFKLVAPSVSNTEVENFFRICDAIAKVEANYVPFVDFKEEEFNPGDYVRVKEGPFVGQTGYLIDQKNNTVVLKMMDGLAAPVKITGAVLEHANIPGVKNAKYALFDEFFGQINPILKRMLSNQHTADDLAYAIHCMAESQKLTDLSPKLKSKQLTLQLICQTLLNNRKEMQQLREDCRLHLPRVKDVNQRAIQAAYTYVCYPIPENHETVQVCRRALADNKQKYIEQILSIV